MGRYCRSCGRGPLRDKRDTTVPSRWRHYARGLDGACYAHVRVHHHLDDYAPIADHTTYREDLRFLLSTGETDVHRLAHRLGVHPVTVRLQRHRENHA